MAVLAARARRTHLEVVTEQVDVLQDLRPVADEIALAIANEVGMPLALAKGIQAGLPQITFADNANRAAEFEWEIR